MSIERLICPTKNAYSLYDEILKAAQTIDKTRMILIALGPTGKILAYDLFVQGYQVIDIGQLDMDYEWYKVGKGIKVHNPQKYFSQMPEIEIENVEDEDYNRQVKIIIDNMI